MKFLINEKQYNLLTEEANGLDIFLNELENRYPEIENFKELIKSFINESGCQNIELKKIHLGAYGLALHDKVVINPTVLAFPLNSALYVIFHEIAHQYQYKKYGRVKMYELYTGELPIDDAVKFLRRTENVADQFSIRKCRELVKMGLITTEGLVKNGNYTHVSDMTFKSLLVKLRNLVRGRHMGNPEKVSEILYNSIVNGQNEEVV
jgi:hypothetical protein